MFLRSFYRHLFQSNPRLGDVNEKLNSTWTVFILLILSLMAYYRTFEKEPLTCWCPQEFTDSMVKFANKYCKETEAVYTLMDDHRIPLRLKDRVLPWKPIYKWIPLILLVQAIFFKLPDVISSAVQGNFGFRFSKIVGLADGYSTLNYNDRALAAKQVGRYVKNWLNSSTLSGLPWGPLTIMYLFTKVLYFINSVVQLSLLNTYLKAENQTSYGEQIWRDIASNESAKWRLDDELFPKMFLCDFSIRKLTNLQTYTVQCLFNNATFYEGLFAFLWLWLQITAILTSFSLGIHGFKILIPIFRRRYLKLYLGLSEEIGGPPQDHMIADFAGSVTEDGVYILKAIGEVSSEHLVRDVVIYLWNSKYRPGAESGVAGQVAPQTVASAPYRSQQPYMQPPQAAVCGASVQPYPPNIQPPHYVTQPENVPLVDYKPPAQ